MKDYEVVGYQIVDYVSKKTNQPVRGTTLFLTYEDNAINGYGTESVYVSDRVRDGQIFRVGDSVNLIYEKGGRLDAIIVKE